MTFKEHVKLIKSNRKRPAKLTRKNIMKFILAAKEVLDEQAVPKKGRKGYYWDVKKGKVVTVKI